MTEEKVPALSPEVLAILDRERLIPVLPPVVRARAMAAARAALATQTVLPPLPSRGRAPLIRWAVAAALTVAAGGATAAAMYHRHTERLGPTSAPVTLAEAPHIDPVPSIAATTTTPAMAALAPASETPAPASADAVSRRSKVVPQEELRLLRQARAAVVREDFAAAMSPIAEHARRFRDGRLAEEREALRIKALSGLGRKDEARRAAAAFESRFPRSVLLPAVRRTPPSGD